VAAAGADGRERRGSGGGRDDGTEGKRCHGYLAYWSRRQGGSPEWSSGRGLGAYPIIPETRTGELDRNRSSSVGSCMNMALKKHVHWYFHLFFIIN
jgi:hypothetical protein